MKVRHDTGRRPASALGFFVKRQNLILHKIQFIGKYDPTDRGVEIRS